MAVKLDIFFSKFETQEQITRMFISGHQINILILITPHF